MKTFSALAVLTAIATPTYAQSFCTCDGTGNVLKFTNNPITLQNPGSAQRAIDQSGRHAFAMAPSRGALSNSNDPAITGGGSLGYNQMLRYY